MGKVADVVTEDGLGPYEERHAAGERPKFFLRARCLFTLVTTKKLAAVAVLSKADNERISKEAMKQLWRHLKEAAGCNRSVRPCHPAISEFRTAEMLSDFFMHIRPSKREAKRKPQQTMKDALMKTRHAPQAEAFHSKRSTHTDQCTRRPPLTLTPMPPPPLRIQSHDREHGLRARQRAGRLVLSLQKVVPACRSGKVPTLCARAPGW